MGKIMRKLILVLVLLVGSTGLGFAGILYDLNLELEFYNAARWEVSDSHGGKD